MSERGVEEKSYSPASVGMGCSWRVGGGGRRGAGRREEGGDFAGAARGNG